jgi:hypothetical protein
VRRHSDRGVRLDLGHALLAKSLTRCDTIGHYLGLNRYMPATVWAFLFVVVCCGAFVLITPARMRA